MKKSLLLLAFITGAFLNSSKAQDSLMQSRLNLLLNQYLHIKDALVEGNVSTAASAAEAYIKTLNGINYMVVPEGNANALLSDAGAISEAKDIEKQRTYFSNFSSNMAMLAKSVKLAEQPVYKMYCPMKKTTWLSEDTVIKNPYTGAEMLNCGKVVETITHQ